MTVSNSSAARPLDDQAYWRASLVVILLALLIVGGLELVSRLLITRISRVERRQAGDFAQAYERSREPTGRPDRRRVLIVGNSLLLAGVDMDALSQNLPAGWGATRIAVDDTSYFDWYYGLRRLFHEGLRFDAVLLMMTPQQFTATTARRNYFARRLMLTRDLWGVARDLDLHPTEAADYFFSSISEFYGMRTEIRKVLLGRLMPSLPQFTGLFVVPRRTWQPDWEDVRRTSETRLQRLAGLTQRHQTRLLLAIPPVPTQPDGAEALRAAGRNAGVPVLYPIPSGGLPDSLYSDGFHLTHEGAAQFTKALGENLTTVLPSLSLVSRQ